MPLSGKILVSTLKSRKASTRTGMESSRSGQPSSLPRPAEAPVAPAPVMASSPPKDFGGEALQELQTSTYVKSILWIGLRLAGALTHAHERGILHRDIKPANVLLTDDGQPMLLDFNLSEDTKQRAGGSVASMGGTLPYMSPEHMRAFEARPVAVDARSDVYSLGVVLFQMLTGKFPFPVRVGRCGDVLKDMIADRSGAVPRLRAINPEITPAAESIIRHCLEPDASRRYQTAEQLHEDLERQLKHLPLKYTRSHRWRNERESGSGVTRGYPPGPASVLRRPSCSCSWARLRWPGNSGSIGWSPRRTFRGFSVKPSRRNLFSMPTSSNPRKYRRASALARMPWPAIGFWMTTHGMKTTRCADLPEPDQEKVLELTGELLFLLADAKVRQAEVEESEGAQHEQLQQAQRPEQASKTSGRTQHEIYRHAHDLVLNGRFREALVDLHVITREQPEYYPAWFSRGNCHYHLEQYPEAIGCFNVCIALRPTFPWAWHSRGAMHLKVRSFRDALADLSRAIELNADRGADVNVDLANAYIDRALAHEGLGQYPEAIADLTQALKLGTPKTRVYFMRAIAHRLAGDRIRGRQGY